ncbi:MAG TPA: polysaccharide biosynthesis protein [Rhodanobacteraceae bacterium]
MNAEIANRVQENELVPEAPARTNGHSIALMQETGSLTPYQLQARRLIQADGVSREMADAFREVRTRLLDLSDGQNFTTLVVPVSAGSGGSFVARNLALAFAFDEARTSLLVDCNLRNPTQDRALEVEADSGGLVDYLEHPATGIKPIVYHTGIPRLRLIPAGKTREAQGEFFSSFRMRAVLDSLRCRYPDRYLFLDGPPIKGGPDARILSDLADYVVVVAGYGRDTPATINRAVAGFDPNKLAGLVFNEA